MNCMTFVNFKMEKNIFLDIFKMKPQKSPKQFRKWWMPTIEQMISDST